MPHVDSSLSTANCLHAIQRSNNYAKHIRGLKGWIILTIILPFRNILYYEDSVYFKKNHYLC